MWFYQQPLDAVIEVKEDASTEVVVEGVRNAEEGRLLAAAPQLREQLASALPMLIWLEANRKDLNLPTELDSLRLRILQSQAALERSK